MIYRFVAIILALTATSIHAAWETITHEGRDYVTVRSIKEFYHFNTLEVGEDFIVLESSAVSCKLSLKSTAAIFNNVLVHLEGPVLKHEDRYLVSRIALSKTIDPILRPSYIRNGSFKTILLDPRPMLDREENDEDKAAGDLTLQVAKKLQREFESADYKVILTRDDEDESDLAAKGGVAFLNGHNNALVISLRITNRDGDQPGMRTWILAPVGAPAFGQELAPGNSTARPGNTHDSANIGIAAALHGRTVLQTGRPDRGVARSRDLLLSGSKNPTVLLELGNLAIPEEAQILASDMFQDKVAAALVGAVAQAQRAMKPLSARQ